MIVDRAGDLIAGLYAVSADQTERGFRTREDDDRVTDGHSCEGSGGRV